MSPRLARPHTRELSDQELAALEAYHPRLIPAQRWAGIRDYVLDSVRIAGPYSASHAQRDLGKITAYVDWAHHVMGRALTHEEVWEHDLIAYYAMHALEHYSTASRATTRSSLLWMADRLNPASRPQPLVRLPRQDLSAPYTPEQIDRMRRWATEQATPYKRHACWVLLALGLGAGLRTQEIDLMRREHIHADEHGVIVQVPGPRTSREVPVLAEWEEHLLVLTDCVAEGSFLFKPERDGSRSKDIGYTTGHSANRPDFRITVGRMRITWQVRLLNAGVPIHLLAQAAGLESLSGIERLLPLLEPPPREQAHALIRADGARRARERSARDREAYNAQHRAYQAAARDLRRQVEGARRGG